VPCDPLQLDQVLANLLENAGKFSPPGSVIGLQAHVVGEEMHLAVANAGPPLTGEEAAHIFDKFFQRRGQGLGAGLGLAICKGLVEAHGGRIWAENLATGGVRFTVALPLTPVPIARSVPA
jgi:two-component system sensor histidine kinase KdpD